MIKSNLQLLDNKPNIFDFPQGTIDAYLIDEMDKKLFKSSLQLFFDSRMSETSIGYKYIKFHLENNFKYLDIVKFAKYPLPAVLNIGTHRIVVNISGLGKRNISNIEPRDLCSLILYSHICGSLSTGDKIPQSSANIFCEYFSAIFLKVFSRKFGITGSYLDLIPYLRFLTSLYILVSFFGFDLKDAIVKARSISKFDVKKIEVNLQDYDLTSINDFVKLLADAQITPGLNIYKFTDTFIKQFGIINLPIFEDLMRCCSSLFASIVPQNNYFSPGFQIIHPKLFGKIIEDVDKICGRGI